MPFRIAMFLVAAWMLQAQQPPGPPPPRSAKGDFTSIPLNPEGRKVTATWDPSKDLADGKPCKAYGAPGLMRLPTRLHITWQDENTLKIETDEGTQTRLFHFAGKPKAQTSSLQGYSAAE